MPSLEIILAYLHLTFKYLPTVLKTTVTHTITRPRQFKKHSKDYKPSTTPETQKTILVIGGSFSGFHLVHLLANSLPTGYRVVLVEKNSHFNYTFNFPRYSVLDSGKEGKAFIPFDDRIASAPQGIYERIVGEVKELREGEAELVSGQVIKFEYLVLATGAKQAPPAKLVSNTKKGACEELRSLQEAIREAKSVALVGGGAVGVQLAGDIKTFFPEKRVVLVHSRNQLLNSFESGRLHEYVVEKMKQLGVEVVLGERPDLGEKKEGQVWCGRSLKFKDNSSQDFDLVIPCTGQSPNSSLLTTISSDSISPQTSRVFVKPTLQLLSPSHTDPKLNSSHFDNVFAIGDVAETNAPRMARAGMMQAEVAWENILKLIDAKEGAKAVPTLKQYKTVRGMEGILKLSLGKDENVTFVPEKSAKGGGYLFPGKSQNIELDVDKTWAYFGAKLEDALLTDDLMV